jgi:geranylgeranyl diphosphate synthase type I
MSSDEKTLGKDIGNDIRNGKKTLIAVHAINNSAAKDKKVLEKLFGNINATDSEVKHVFEIFKKTGSIKYAKTTAESYCTKAIDALKDFPETDAKKILIELAKYSIERKY